MKTTRITCRRIASVILATLATLPYSAVAYQLGTCETLPLCSILCSPTIPGDCVKEAKDTGFHLYSFCPGGYCRAYKSTINSFDIRYTHSPSLIWVPSTSTTDLREIIHDIGQSICLAGQSSQPGTYVVTGMALDGKSLSVTPAPQTATDQALDIVLSSTPCP